MSAPSYKSASAVTVTQQDEARITPHDSKDAAGFTCAEEPQNIPEPSTHDLSTVLPGCLHLPSITLPSIAKQTESRPISPLMTRSHAKPYCTMTESKYQFRATCNTQWPVPFPGHQASEIAVSSPIMEQRQLKSCVTPSSSSINCFSCRFLGFTSTMRLKFVSEGTKLCRYPLSLDINFRFRLWLLLP